MESPGSMAVKVFGMILENRDLRENVSPFPFFFSLLSFPLIITLFPFSVRQDPEIINFLEGGGNRRK